MQQYRTFLETMYHGKNKKDYILIWNNPGRASKFCKNIDDAVQHVSNLAGSRNVYFGVCTSPENYGVNRRCKMNKAAGIPGLYLDIDYSCDAAHKKSDLPPSLDDAMELTRIHGLTPSMVIHSGHGIHAYYLFKDFWNFTSDDERIDAADLAKRLNKACAAIGEERGWAVDSVFDLARVLRVPGTMNMKDGMDAVEAKILSIDAIRYTREQFESALPKLEETPKEVPLFSEDELATEVKPTAKKAAPRAFNSVFDAEVARLKAELVISPFQTVSPARMESLADISGPKFWATWDNKRKDLRDDSASSFDGSLLMFALRAGWTEQECCDLMIAHRHHMGHNLKLENRQYYARSIVTQRDFIASGSTKKKNPPPRSEVVPIPVNGIIDADAKRQLNIASLSSKFGVMILKITKYLEDPEPIYYLTAEVEDRQTGRRMPKEIKLGTVSGIIDGRIFRNKVAALANVIIETMKAAKWAKIAQQLIDSCIEIDVAPEMTDLGQIDVWLHEFLGNKEQRTLIDAVDTKDPFIEGGVWHFWKDKFFRWCKTVKHCELGEKTFLVNMRRYGCRPQIVHLKIDNKRTTRSVWSAPANFTII